MASMKAGLVFGAYEAGEEGEDEDDGVQGARTAEVQTGPRHAIRLQSLARPKGGNWEARRQLEE